MRRLLFTLSLCTFFISFSFSALAAEIAATRVPDVTPPGFTVHFKAKQAPDLAGIKLVLIYDAEKLKYKEMNKAKETRSMMHVVNDKNPGKLIIVMASATGQKTPDFSLFDLSFELLTNGTENKPLEIELSNVEMMSAALVEIPCSPQTFSLE